MQIAARALLVKSEPKRLVNGREIVSVLVLREGRRANLLV
jgi:hypothetical protein